MDAYAERARQALPAFFTPLEVVAALPSTMLRAAELAAGGAPEGATVLADAQTAGRGRLGRAWAARPGTSLLLSVVLRPRLPAEAAWLVTAVAGVALAEAAEAVAAGLRPVLKWPNDLLVGERKVAGLLAEARVEGDRLAWVVLGMGVNVAQRPGDFPPQVAPLATSLALAAGRPLERADLLGSWARRFLAGYRALAAGDPAPVLAAYRERLGTLGRRVRLERVGAEPAAGLAVGLTADGGLVVETGTGARLTVTAADVEHLREAAVPAASAAAQPPTSTGTATE